MNPNQTRRPKLASSEALVVDGVAAIGPPYEANISQCVNGEPIVGQDIVIWYGAHVTHDVNAELPGEYGHLVGPDLKLMQW